MVVRDPESAAYRQVAAALRIRLAAGEWRPGAFLPSEPYLASEYGVGRDSVRRSLSVLAGEGLIRRPEPGQRWTVALPAERAELWVRPKTRVVFRPPTAEERRDYGIPDGVAVAEIYHHGTWRLVRGDEYELWFE